MKTTAYICNCCFNLFPEKLVKGVLNKPDIFDAQNSFPVCPINKTEIHFCNECYNNRVTNLVNSMLSNNEKIRQLKMKVPVLNDRSGEDLTRDYFSAFRSFLVQNKPKK